MSRDKKHWSLRSLLLLLFLPLVLFGLFLMPWGISQVLEHQFQKRSQEAVTATLDTLASALESLYQEAGQWNPQELNRLSLWSLPVDIIELELRDAEETLVWSEKTSRLSRHNDHNDVTTTPIEFKRFLQLDDKKIGTLRLLSLTFVESHDGQFISYFNSTLFLSVLLIAALVGAAALWIALRLSQPIKSVSRRAVELSHGRYAGEALPWSSIAEVNELSESIENLAQSLNQQEQLRKRLLSDMAHELRTPLTIVKTHLEALQDGIWQPTAERLTLTIQEVDRLARLITEVEKISTLEETELSINKKEFELTTLITETIHSFEPLFQNKSVTLMKELQPDITVHGDASRLQQALSNLLSNSLRYTPSGGTVTVALACDSHIWTLKVSDTGMGIESKDLPWIFERLYRSDQSRSRHEGGQGIGLALVKAIVEAHGGTVSACSSLHEGSTFTLRFPLH